MSSLAIRRQLRRHRRRLALMAAVFVLGGLTAAHHGGPLMGAHDDGVGAAVGMCLAVFTAIATVGALGCAVLGLQQWRPVLTLVSSATLTLPRVPVARARHGPAAVSVLCVSRR